MTVDPGVVVTEPSLAAAAHERHRTHARVVRSIVAERCGAGFSPRRVAVVGAGDGAEAAALALEWGSPSPRTVAVDLHADFDPGAARRVACVRADAASLPIRSGAADLVYSYHALEHVPRWREAIAEFRRVLAPGGAAFVGVPNKRRLLAYVCNRSVRLSAAIAWNVKDWVARLRGRFENELGAHAGFTEEELRDALGREFSSVASVRTRYFALKYPGKGRFLVAIEDGGFADVVYPSNYFLCRE
jgi:ubiquinone/menaquinone biosynthesis C-methylase UbiE